MKKVVCKFLLIIIWLLVIFIFSNQNGIKSTGLTNNFLNTYLSFVDSDVVFILIRKIAHVTEYFILGILVISLLYDFNINKKATISILICIIFATMDEFHQLFVDGRTGRFVDVIIDSIGFGVGILVYSKIKKKKP